MRTWITCRTDNGEIMFPVDKVVLAQKITGVEGVRLVLADGLGTHLLNATFEDVVKFIQTS